MDLFSRMHLSVSRSKVDKASDASTFQRIKEGFKESRTGYVAWLLDNTGFKIIGGGINAAGYCSQHIVIQFLGVPASVPWKMGFKDSSQLFYV